MIIAQRVSSILHADHILVLEEGKELGYGAHQHLLETCEVYQDIARSQMGFGSPAATVAEPTEPAGERSASAVDSPAVRKEGT